jgi:D-alanyl-D-alanine carboxypeptidase/D-alanyl-D-alanine-endopeptidase (penicillin-binding protein 4)
LFGVEEIDPGRFDNDPTRPYNVGPDALLVNYKSVRLQFIPVEQTGGVRIIASPELPLINIVNQLTLGPSPCDVWPERPAADLLQSRLTFSGVFPYGCGEKQRSFSLLSRNQYLVTLFTQLWRESGGTFQGTVRDGAVPDRARWLTTWESAPLAQVVRDINKFSNNVMARHLYLTLSLAAANPPATTDNAARAVRAWLLRNHLDFPELNLDNGSGLSRTARISARHLAELLAYAWRSPFMPEYISSLPIPGVDGTLRRRMGDSPVAGRAHIKTGYLDGVRAIAGYVSDDRGRTFIVVSLINDSHAINAQNFQEAVIDWVYAQASQPRCCRE